MMSPWKVELALEERDSKNAGVSFVCVCVCSPLHTCWDIHIKTHQQRGVCSNNYGDIFESPRKKSS